MTSGAFYFPMLRKRARILARTYKRLLALPVLSWVCYPSSQIEYDRNSFCRVTGRARTPNSPIFLFLMRGPARASLSDVYEILRSRALHGRAQDLVLLPVLARWPCCLIAFVAPAGLYCCRTILLGSGLGSGRVRIRARGRCSMPRTTQRAASAACASAPLPRSPKAALRIS